MALTTTLVSGLVPLPDGTAPDGAVLRFTLSDVDVDGALIAPAPVECAVTAEGAIAVALWPNARGARGTHYIAMLVLPATPDLPGRQIRLGQITVPDTGTAELHALLA
ncbi:MAG: hypothetical protein QM656_15320 [Paracoccaceae bacterium]